MTLSTTINKASYSGDGNTATFNYNFKIFTNSDLKVIIRSASGTETLKTITTHYTVSGAGSNSGGSVTFTGGNIPTNTETVILQRVVPLTQTHDYVENDPFPAESHEQGLDRLTMHVQQLQEEVDRSIKASVTNTISSTEFTNDATDRANKLFAFDSSGNINIATTVGSNKGNWATATAYAERDIVKDTSTNNIFQCKTAHTSSGSQPLTTNTDSAKWDLLVDAESATTSATNAQTSAVNSANSATASANSATASQASAVNSATSEANASTSENNASASAQASANSATASANSATSSATTLTNFEKQYLGSKSSAPTADNDGNTLDATYEGTLYFNSSNDELYVWNGSAWEQASFSAGGFMSQNNNLSDVANVATSRTNLGLGTASTLNVGTSANNVVQLDGNAKLPAVSGENLTGLSAGTDAIDMVVGTGSDAISVGDVITRESNGETKKVKKTTTTQNLSLGQSSSSTSGPNGNTQMGDSSYLAEYPASTAGVANDSGKYCIFYRGTSSRTYIQIFDYDSASSTWSVPTGNYCISNPNNTNVTGTAFQGTGSNITSPTARNYLRWHKNMNSSAGGTWMILWHYRHSAGNHMYYVTPFTIDANNVINLYTRQKLIARNDGQASGDDFYQADTSIKSMTTDNCDFITAGYHYITYSWPYNARFVISARRLTWGGSSYSISDLGTSTVSSINGNSSQLTSVNRPVRVMYDYTTDRVGVFWLDTNRRNRFTVWENTGNANSYTWNPMYTEQLTTDANSGTFDSNQYWNVQFQKADGKGRVVLSYLHYYSSPSVNYKFRTFVIVMGASSLTVTTLHSTNSSSTFWMSPAQMFLYDYLNDRYLSPYSSVYPIYGNGFRQSLNYYQPSGNSLAVETSVTGGGLSDAYQYGHMLAMVDTMSITAINSANAGKWLQLHKQGQTTITSISVNTGSIHYSSGNIPHTLTTSTTNKSLAFGYAQKAGNAGDTISVLPFKSESLEQNQTGLTDGQKLYVSSTGAIVTNTTPDADIYADPDNPFIGEAIGTTNIRLPSYSVSAGASNNDTSKIFCGAVDLQNDAGVSTNFLLSKPSTIDASDIRAYIIEYYGVYVGTNSSYNVRVLPYNGGSSVWNSTMYGNYHYSEATSNSTSSLNMSSYMKLAYHQGQTAPLSQATGNTQDSTGNGYSPSLHGRMIYENNKHRAGYQFDSWVRYNTNNNQVSYERGVFGANNNQTVTNYADALYVYISGSTFIDGIFIMYAITK